MRRQTLLNGELNCSAALPVGELSFGNLRGLATMTAIDHSAGSDPMLEAKRQVAIASVK